MTDLERLRAENARLKTALLHIKDGRGYCSFCGEIASGPMGGVLSCDCSAAGYHWEHDPVKIARAALSADHAPVAGVTVPVGAVEAIANYQQGDMDGTLVLVSRQAIEECLPALRAIAGENGNG